MWCVVNNLGSSMGSLLLDRKLAEIENGCLCCQCSKPTIMKKDLKCLRDFKSKESECARWYVDSLQTEVRSRDYYHIEVSDMKNKSSLLSNTCSAVIRGCKRASVIYRSSLRLQHRVQRDCKPATRSQQRLGTYRENVFFCNLTYLSHVCYGWTPLFSAVWQDINHSL